MTPVPDPLHRLVRPIAVVAAAIVAVVAAVAAIDQASLADASTPTTVTVRDYRCADAWHPPRSGQWQIRVFNAGSSVVDVTLVGADEVLTYGEVEGLAPGTTRTMTALVPPGRYRLACSYSENATVYSPKVTVTGSPVTGAHPYRRVTYAQLAGPVTHYRAEVTAGLVVLSADTDHLRALADTGQIEPAKQAWLVAHLDYARLGAAYGTFGDLDDAIDGRPDGLPQGVHDPQWTGFLRLEYALWQNQSTATVATVADALDDAVHQLVVAFPQQTTPPNDLSLRTHEILENTLQFELTGATDEGSHTGLATAMANVQGTEMTLGAIAPLLRQGEPALLASASDQLTRLGDLLSGYRRPDGTWTPVQSLTRAQRQQLDATIGAFLETVSPVPDLLELPVEAASP